MSADKTSGNNANVTIVGATNHNELHDGASGSASSINNSPFLWGGRVNTGHLRHHSQAVHDIVDNHHRLSPGERDPGSIVDQHHRLSQSNNQTGVSSSSLQHSASQTEQGHGHPASFLHNPPSLQLSGPSHHSHLHLESPRQLHPQPIHTPHIQTQPSDIRNQSHHTLHHAYGSNTASGTDVDDLDDPLGINVIDVWHRHHDQMQDNTPSHSQSNMLQVAAPQTSSSKKSRSSGAARSSKKPGGRPRDLVWSYFNETPSGTSSTGSRLAAQCKACKWKCEQPKAFRMRQHVINCEAISSTDRNQMQIIHEQKRVALEILNREGPSSRKKSRDAGAGDDDDVEDDVDEETPLPDDQDSDASVPRGSRKGSKHGTTRSIPVDRHDSNVNTNSTNSTDSDLYGATQPDLEQVIPPRGPIETISPWNTQHNQLQQQQSSSSYYPNYHGSTIDNSANVSGGIQPSSTLKDPNASGSAVAQRLLDQYRSKGINFDIGGNNPSTSNNTSSLKKRKRRDVKPSPLPEGVAPFTLGESTLLSFGQMAPLVKSPITCHVLDSSAGRPGSSIKIRMEQLGQTGFTHVATGTTDSDGRANTLMPIGTSIEKDAIYKLTFYTREYFDRLGTRTFYPFVEVTFQIAEPSEHYHVAVLLSPWSFTTYRGS